MKILTATCLAATCLLLAAAPRATGMKVGDAAPGWSGIIGVDGKKHALADYRKAKLVVLVFTCNHCPVAQSYQDRLIALQKEYGKKGVQVVAVNVNKAPRDALEKMKERAREKKYNFPYLFDPTQKIARDYGAKVTPHAFLLDRDRKIAYRGSIDDDKDAKKVKEHSLKNAIDALLAGKRPPKTETRPFGCGIKYEKGKK
ncbi:MAG: thioredoxin family protein [Pirellulales bacterium]|nr:thioredoxin family protein [Pirellulales bacterium]